ncbi:BglG family transcription antiterminator [Terrilactibacillus tamarindi]|uniref:BglG family transcription antiterminator n=1 Tax=Terrilactibacillus tamarindi TaxID=2599694 RepID=UPI001E2C702D|nr:transcription antiterminator [Terrilactibacillus tamarindi]
MELDERSTNIIQEILKNPSISKKKLEEKYQYSRRQISYSMMKINQWLTEHNFPEIWRSKNGAFIVHPSVLDALSSNIKTEKIWYVPTEKERIYFLLLMLISNEGELSLFHFMSTLQVSKNTILRDLRHAKKDLTAYDLQINYTRSKGYHLTGDEWNIRKLLVDVIEKVSNIYNGEYFIQHLTLAEDIQKHHKQLEDVEEQLQLRFTDEKMKILPYLISIMMKRIERGCYVKRSFSIDYDELSDTKEYRAAERILRDERTVPKEEKLYMTLQLLTSNVLGSSLLTDSELPKLKMVIKQCLDIFEERACIVIKEKDELLNKLFLHIKPAYYRIKYHLTTEYASIEKMMKEFETVHYIVTDAFKPLEKFIGCDIPTSELAMISVFISGHLITNQEIKEDKKRAVVVCPQGLSISQLMESVLRKLFPEFFFYPAMSLREYHKEVKPYDIVFSSIPIQTDKKLFIVDHFITDLEKIQLRERVLKDIFGFGSSALNMNHLLSIIERHTQITDKESLQKELAEYFSYQHEKK